MSGFEKMFASEKSRFDSIYSVKATYFAFLLQFFEAWFWNETFQNASDFDLKVLQRVRFAIGKKHFQSRIERVMLSFQKKTQHVRVSVKNYTTLERRIDGWQLPAVHLAT